ncbi:MAG: hypothetical protein WBY53_13840, partial [Acidobacteriaceae bacterium]
MAGVRKVSNACGLALALCVAVLSSTALGWSQEVGLKARIRGQVDTSQRVPLAGAQRRRPADARDVG